MWSCAREKISAEQREAFPRELQICHFIGDSNAAAPQALQAIGCAVDARAQELSPKEFVLLHNRLYGLTPPAEGAAPSPKHNRKYDLEEEGAGAGAEGSSEV